MEKQSRDLLKTVFGFDEFKPLQQEIIANVLNRRDTLVIMPTGGGKSLCYQLPALIFKGLTVVVSPLISLMKDQVEQLNELGVPAVFLNSSLALEEYRDNMERIRRKEIKLLYLAPEALLTSRVLSLLASVQLDCLTIDEAHCISEWGHDFRPEYRQLVAVRQRFPAAVCIALTATATTRVRADIKSNLSFETSNEFIASFNRENLFIEIVPKNEPTHQTIQFIRKFPGQSGIIYCFSRRQVDELSAVLRSKGFSVLPYHAGLSDEERKHNQELFIRDDVQIIVATIAFGMGINKPNVRFVVHYDLPKNLESYYQEIGRAGRDGLRSHCLLLFSYGDVQKIKYFINQKDEPERQIANQHLNALLRFAESDVCRRIPLLGHFGEVFEAEACDLCDNCLGAEKKLVDVTIPAQKFLSCVKRTGEIFGANHIIDVLLGSENEKVIKFGHQNLSTYGIGKEYSKKQWQRLSRQLMHKGFMHQEGEYGSLKLTTKAYELFKNKATVLGVMEDEPEVAPSRARRLAEKEPDYNQGLFEALRQKRKELADESRVPPYVIFSDKSLVEMARYLPLSPESFLGINGVGSAKLQKYGQVFIDLIQAYCREHNLDGTSSQEPLPASRLQKTPRHIQVGEAFTSGQSVAEIAAAFSVQTGTVIEHLYKYLLEGHPLRPEEILRLSTLPAGEQSRALEAFDRLGAEYLRPVFDALDETISFDELKILRMVYLCRQTE